MHGNRSEAVRVLADALEPRVRGEAPVVLALPRGDVPMAVESVHVRKIGASNQPALAIGAVADGLEPHFVMYERLIAEIDVPTSCIEGTKQRKLAEILATAGKLSRRSRLPAGCRPHRHSDRRGKRRWQTPKRRAVQPQASRRGANDPDGFADTGRYTDRAASQGRRNRLFADAERISGDRLERSGPQPSVGSRKRRCPVCRWRGCETARCDGRRSGSLPAWRP